MAFSRMILQLQEIDGRWKDIQSKIKLGGNFVVWC